MPDEILKITPAFSSLVSDFLQRVPIALELNNGLTHIWSRTIRFKKETPPTLRIDNLAFTWVFVEADEEAVIDVTADENARTSTYTIRGKLPQAPYALLNLAPEAIAIASGYHIHLSQDIGVTGKDNDWVNLSLSLYINRNDQSLDSTANGPQQSKDNGGGK